MESNGGHSKDQRTVPLWALFKYADSIDWWLVGVGSLGSIGDGVSTPVLMIVMGALMDTLGNYEPSSQRSRIEYLHTMNKYSLEIVYIGITTGFAAFLSGFCWTRTGERQASCMRRKYLKAVLRQDVGFFDIQGTTTSQVVTSVSNDTLVIQDVLAERIPDFLKNAAFFISSYIVAFYLTWRLAVVAFPFVVFLIIPGVMYGRILVGIAHKTRKANSIACNIAEQTLSSIRTVFSFVGEETTITKFADALNESVKLGIKQGLIKGIAVGSTGVVFCMWAFISWYGTRQIMYHGANGGRVFATGTTLILGGA
ncbi:hypothetical protein SUGI_0738900 [Cryptomeria japonica]|nr:hypothetical protein SUGI_0738900 [Cryptomeria japonica]